MACLISLSTHIARFALFNSSCKIHPKETIDPAAVLKFVFAEQLLVNMFWFHRASHQNQQRGLVTAHFSFV